MDLVFKKDTVIQNDDVNMKGVLSLSALLRYVQEISGNHSDQLGFSWNQLWEKGIFWAVLRHKAVIHRLPKCGESIHLQTWPMPTTRSAYPRAVRATDSQGNLLFETVSLWVLMNTQTRAMVLPGKSDVDVPGFLGDIQIGTPSSLPPSEHDHFSLWHVESQDLDINGHVNNGRYLQHIEKLVDNLSLSPNELTVCYLSEALLDQELTLHWSLSNDGVLSVDGTRLRTDVHAGVERVFAVKLCCSVN